MPDRFGNPPDDADDPIAEPGVRHLVTYRRNAKPRRADRHALAAVTAGGNHHGVALVDEQGRQWHRLLSNRECARAQGFPDSYEFTGTAAEVARWLGERATKALGAAS